MKNIDFRAKRSFELRDLNFIAIVKWNQVVHDASKANIERLIKFQAEDYISRCRRGDLITYVSGRMI